MCEKKCEICLAEEGPTKIVNKCSTCTFVACKECVEEWYKCVKKETCPQCKLVFKTPIYDSFILYFNYINMKTDSVYRIDGPVTNETFHNFFIKIKNAKADLLIIYDGTIIGNHPLKRTIYFDIEDGLWRPLDSAGGKKFMAKNVQDQIFNKDRTKVFNKNLKRWESVQNNTGASIEEGLK